MNSQPSSVFKTAKAERYVAALITSSRTFGLAAESAAQPCDGIILTLDDESNYYDS
jgi:hypothetical protein